MRLCVIIITKIIDVTVSRYPINWLAIYARRGTTDYAVDIFHEAIKKENILVSHSSIRILPMMYMADAIKATIAIMDASVKNKNKNTL